MFHFQLLTCRQYKTIVECRTSGLCMLFHRGIQNNTLHIIQMKGRVRNDEPYLLVLNAYDARLLRVLDPELVRQRLQHHAALDEVVELHRTSMRAIEDAHAQRAEVGRSADRASDRDAVYGGKTRPTPQLRSAEHGARLLSRGYYRCYVVHTVKHTANFFPA